MKLFLFYASLFSMLLGSIIYGQQNIFRLFIPIDGTGGNDYRYGKTPYDGPPFAHFVQKQQYYHPEEQILNNVTKVMSQFQAMVQQ